MFDKLFEKVEPKKTFDFDQEVSECTFRHWTLCDRAGYERRKVNAAPDGRDVISLLPCCDETDAALDRQYNGGDPNGGWVLARTVFAKKPDGTRALCEGLCDEAYFLSSDFVLSEEGMLIGFLAREDKVLWIADFAEGGKYRQSEYGMFLCEYFQYDAEYFDEERGEIVEGDFDCVEYGYLTHSRW